MHFNGNSFIWKFSISELTIPIEAKLLYFTFSLL